MAMWRRGEATLAEQITSASELSDADVIVFHCGLLARSGQEPGFVGLRGDRVFPGQPKQP